MLQQQVYRLFDSEIEHWQLAHDKYACLEKSLNKQFDFGDFRIDITCNPARMRSTLADVQRRLEQMRSAPNSLNVLPFEREDKCFLCQDVRPNGQKYIEIGDFQILVNPYPIFPKHFTIAHKRHIPQLIVPYFAEFLYFAEQMTDFAIFYNGANCGASAPFHTHFQSAERRYFNVINDYKNLPEQYFDIVENSEHITVKRFRNYLRQVVCISASDTEKAKEVFVRMFSSHIEANMLNVVCCFEEGRYLIFVFPRKKFRPTQFFEDDEQKRLAISPASVELSGRFVTIFEDHFDRITKDEIIDIYEQIS